MSRCIMLGLVSSMSGACTTLELQLPDGSRERSYFGWLKVKNGPLPNRADQGSVVELNHTGLATGLGTGFMLGWSRERHIRVPLDCHVVVLLAPGAVLPPDVARAIGRGDACAYPVER